MSDINECQGDQAGSTGLDAAIKHWHASEMEASRLRDALTQVLRLQTGVSQQAKTIIRLALAASPIPPAQLGSEAS